MAPPTSWRAWPVWTSPAMATRRPRAASRAAASRFARGSSSPARRRRAGRRPGASACAARSPAPRRSSPTRASSRRRPRTSWRPSAPSSTACAASSKRSSAMTYAESERYLLSLELFGMRFGLDRMRRLMTALGSPQERFGTIHVAGTNGKSSTVRMAAAILARHGLRAGAYLSPHLVSFTERIRIDDGDVSEERFGAAVARAARAAEKVNRTLEADDRVTQFEALTAAAYSELAEAGVDVAAIEAGLGGRYDATNVIPSRVQVLTNVGLEHTRWLGPTIADVAAEKLDIVRAGATLVVGADLHDDAM